MTATADRSSDIRVESEGSVHILRLCRPSVNAMDLEFCDQIIAALADLQDAGAVVITATGPVFSAGVDLARFLAEDADYIERFVDALERMCENLLAFGRPVVAAINGHAVAGGCVLACTADRRIMASGDGKIGVPELHVGVPFPPAPLEVMRFAVPSRYHEEVIQRGQMYDPDEALERGLIHEVVSADSLMERAMASAREMAQLRSEAFQITKQLLREPALERIRADRVRFDATIRDVWKSPDTRQAIRAYFEARVKRS